jgi:hypothetical protein
MDLVWLSGISSDFVGEAVGASLMAGTGSTSLHLAASQRSQSQAPMPLTQQCSLPVPHILQELLAEHKFVAAVGVSVGASVGAFVGLALGIDDGATVVIAEGLIVGRTAGKSVGTSVSTTPVQVLFTQVSHTSCLSAKNELQHPLQTLQRIGSHTFNNAVDVTVGTFVGASVGASVGEKVGSGAVTAVGKVEGLVEPASGQLVLAQVVQ